MYRKYCIALFLVVGFSAPVWGQASDDFKERSRAFMAAAHTALTVGDYAKAQADFERALVADPNNVDAMVGMGQAHEGAGRTGSGLRAYRLALEIEPNYKPALAAQSLAFLKVAEADRASANLMILERLCTAGCVELDTVRDALEAHVAETASNESLDDAGDQ